MIRTVIDLIRETTQPDEDRHWAVGCSAGAVMAAIGWFTVENIWQFHQSGELFEPRGWSFTHLIVWVIVGVVVGAIAGWHGRTWRRRHEEGIRAVAAQLGFEYSANAESLRWLSGHFPMLRNWHQSEHLMGGERDGMRIEMCDLTTRWIGMDSAGYSNKTVVLLPTEGLPDFDIAQRSFLMKGKWSGLRFDAGATPESDASAVAEFTRRCVVHCGFTGEDSWGASPQGTPEAELAVRNLLTPALMRSLTPFADWWIESRAGRLALSRGRGFRPPSERANMIAQAIAIRSILIETTTMTGCNLSRDHQENTDT